MCQLSGVSKAGTKQNSTRTVDCCLFSTRSSFECLAKPRTWGFERQDFVSFCDNVFLAFCPTVLSACGVEQ